MLRWTLLAAAIAGLAGAGAIVLAAVAGHLVQDQRLHTAAYFLLFHASATLAACCLAITLPSRGAWFLAAAYLFLLGSLLFGGELSLRALSGTSLFAIAAPFGGLLMIAGWLAVTLAAVATLRSSTPNVPLLSPAKRSGRG